MSANAISWSVRPPATSRVRGTLHPESLQRILLLKRLTGAFKVRCCKNDSRCGVGMDYAIIQNGFTRKDHYVCFDCRKCFKRPSFRFVPTRPLTSDERQPFSRHIRMRLNQSVICPNCGKLSRFAGRDFKAPKMRDLKGWERVRRFLDSGRAYYRGTPTDDIRSL